MSGDWIKMRQGLLTSPKVNGIARMIEADPDVSRVLSTGYNGAMREIVTRNVMRYVTVTALLAVWGAANEHTSDGVFHNADLSDIDDIAGIPGFGRAMAAVGWAIYDEERQCVYLPNFEEYNTCGRNRSAEKAAERQRKYRERKKAEQARSDALVDATRDVTRDVTRDATSDATRNGREEKSREELNTPPLPPRKRGAGHRFEDFWLSWPKSERKQDKAKCLDHWKRHDLDAIADAIIADVRVKRGTRKWQDGFIEAPLVYLRGRRWEDGVEPDPTDVPPAERIANWWETRQGVESKAAELGLGPWDETEQWPIYRARVLDAAGPGPWHKSVSAPPPAVAEALAGAVKQLVTS